MKRLLVVLAVLAFVPSIGWAAPVYCPDPMTAGQTRQYWVNPAASPCLVGTGATINGNPSNDDFIAQDWLGFEWTFVGSTQGWGAALEPFTGLTITNPTPTSFSWAINPASWGPGIFALVLKDGGEPRWAAFQPTALSGTAGMSSTEGSLSHVALYTTATPVPEPASMLLLGTGLLGAATAARRRRR